MYTLLSKSPYLICFTLSSGPFGPLGGGHYCGLCHLLGQTRGDQGSARCPQHGHACCLQVQPLAPYRTHARHTGAGKHVHILGL